jgi:ABC-type microcin C transport system permease subunit YejB
MTENDLLQLIKNGESSKVQFDVTEIFDTDINDLNKDSFSDYFKKEFEMTYEAKGLSLEQALIAKKVMRNNYLTVLLLKKLNTGIRL